MDVRGGRNGRKVILDLSLPTSWLKCRAEMKHALCFGNITRTTYIVCEPQQIGWRLKRYNIVGNYVHRMVIKSCAWALALSFGWPHKTLWYWPPFLLAASGILIYRDIRKDPTCNYQVQNTNQWIPFILSLSFLTKIVRVGGQGSLPHFQIPAPPFGFRGSHDPPLSVPPPSVVVAEIHFQFDLPPTLLQTPLPVTPLCLRLESSPGCSPRPCKVRTEVIKLHLSQHHMISLKIVIRLGG